jgi:hypothetical protein
MIRTLATAVVSATALVLLAASASAGTSAERRVDRDGPDSVLTGSEQSSAARRIDRESPDSALAPSDPQPAAARRLDREASDSVGVAAEPTPFVVRVEERDAFDWFSALLGAAAAAGLALVGAGLLAMRRRSVPAVQ